MRSRSNKSGMKKPKSGGTPKKIVTENPPGGPYTPGAKKDKKK